MGAPTVMGYGFVRTTEGRVRLLSMMDFHDGYTSYGTVAECEATPEALAAAVQAEREQIEVEIARQHVDHLAFLESAKDELGDAWDETELSDPISGVSGETLEWRAFIDKMKVPASTEEIAQLELRTVGGYTDIQVAGGNVARPQDLLHKVWQVVEAVPDPDRYDPKHLVVVAEGLTFPEAWELAKRGPMLRPLESDPLCPAKPDFRPSFCFSDH